MASEYFWDTSGFFALLDKNDEKHMQALQWMAKALEERKQSITTE
jgi:hypothetical protein